MLTLRSMGRKESYSRFVKFLAENYFQPTSIVAWPYHIKLTYHLSLFLYEKVANRKFLWVIWILKTTTFGVYNAMIVIVGLFGIRLMVLWWLFFWEFFGSLLLVAWVEKMTSHTIGGSIQNIFPRTMLSKDYMTWLLVATLFWKFKLKLYILLVELIRYFDSFKSLSRTKSTSVVEGIFSLTT